MKLIYFDNYEIKVADEALLIKPIRKLFNQDRTANKEKFFQQMSYMYFMINPASTYMYIIDSEERAKEIASRNIVKEKKKYKEMLESLQNDKAQLESEKLAKMSEAEKTAYQISELNKKLEDLQKQSSEKEKAFEFERLTNQTKDLLVEKGLPGALANMVMAGADGEAEAIQKNIATLQEYVNQAIDAGVEARIKASSGTPKAFNSNKSGFTLDDIRKMSPAEINAHWDEISKQGKLR